MKQNRTFMLLLATLAFSSTVGTCQASGDTYSCQDTSRQACNQPRESQCRSAIEAMLQTIKATPLQTERDANDVKTLLASIDKMLADNRSKNIDECRSWSDLGRIVANQ